MAEKKEQLQAILVKLMSGARNEKGMDMYTHLQKVLVSLALNDPHSALERFEEISYEIRSKGKYEPDEGFLDYSSIAVGLQPWLSSLKESFFDAKKPAGDDPASSDPPPEPAPLGYIPDLLNDNKILEWAGLGFGTEDSYFLMKSLKKLATKAEVKTLRLWGKVSGIYKDYYIAEGDKESAADSNLPPEIEPRGTGVNKYIYWVTDSIAGNWTELPDTSPAKIKIARQIKKLFTGNLEEEVSSNPSFPGKEKDLLRAQIARVTQSTSIIPKGFYKKQEDNEREIIELGEEEKKLPPFQELAKLETWCHLTPNILKCGRTTHLQPEQPKDEPGEFDAAKALKDLELKDPYDARLKPLSQDIGCGENPYTWSLKVTGDPQMYKEEGKKPPSSTGIIVIRSLIWPGAYILYQNERWFNFYVGYGHKADEKSYYPIDPPLLQTECQDITEQPEPNPKEEPNKGPEDTAGILARLEEALKNPELFKAILEQAFDAVDTDKSGQIDAKELEAFLKGIITEMKIGIVPGEKEAKEFMNLFDKDHSGTISKTELAEPFKEMLTMWVALLREKLIPPA